MEEVVGSIPTRSTNFYQHRTEARLGKPEVVLLIPDQGPPYCISVEVRRPGKP
jgi:hypothetical protein